MGVDTAARMQQVSSGDDDAWRDAARATLADMDTALAARFDRGEAVDRLEPVAGAGDPQEGGYRQAGAAAVDAPAIAGDDPRILQPADALGHRRLRQPDPSSEGAIGQARVLLQGFENPAVHVVGR